MTDHRVARDHMHRAQQELEQARRLLSAEIMRNPTSVGQGDVQHAHLIELHRQVSAALKALVAGTGGRA